MTTPSTPRSYTALAAAIVVAALIVGTSIYVILSAVSTTTFTDTSALPATTTTSATTVCLCPELPGTCPCASQEGNTTSTYGGGGPTVTTTTPTGAIITKTAADASNPNNLRLNLTIGSNGGTNITISAEESNLLDLVNNVTTANAWPFPDTDSLACGNYDQFPIQYAVLQGSYGTNNYTLGSPLTLYDTAIAYPCPTIATPAPYLLFGPLSDNASRYFPQGQEEENFTVSANYSVTGYWTGSQSTAAYHQFPPGTYTVLAEDEWGDVALLHFTLVVFTVTETVSAISSSSSATCTAAATINETSTTEVLMLCHTTTLYTNPS